MSIRTATVAALVSAMLLGAGTAFAAPPPDGNATSFATQLSEAKRALRDISNPVDRLDRVSATIHLQYAEALFNQGRSAEAQQYLHFARGKVRLVDSSVTRAAPVLRATQAFIPDFYNPVR